MSQVIDRRWTHRCRRIVVGAFAALLSASAGVPSAQELPQPCAGGCGGAQFAVPGRATYTVNGAGTVGTIKQNVDRAILNWQNFNIGAGKTVQFKQPSSTSAALNRIHQSDPSKILGALKANGEVYLINQNGIVFGAGAQINTGSLTASTLNVSDEVFNNTGVTGALNQETALPAFSGESKGGVRVEKGATLRSGKNGRVLLIGSDVVNAGRIETPDGQALLVGAKDKVYVAADSEVRGLLVEVDTGGTVTNLGEIISECGNTTMVGLAVNQKGRVSATTSVNLNGSIRLSARDGASDPGQWQLVDGKRTPLATRTGNVALGKGSQTEVLPDTSAETATDAVAQPRSRVDMMGRTVKLESGAKVKVPGGIVSVKATSNPQLPLSGGDRTAKVSVEKGAMIDVSGDASTVVPMERNQSPAVKLLGDVVADSPVVRQGPLARQDIYFDLRRGTTLANVKAFQEGIKRTVAERLAKGGEVQLSAEGDVVLKSGSIVDFSGGSVKYLAGYLATTRLVTMDGRLVDIGEADPLLPYAGIFGQMIVEHAKWGVRDTYQFNPTGTLPAFHAGYIEGKDAGSLLIESRTGGVELAGKLRGGTRRGHLQRDPAADIDADPVRPYDEVPLGGKLSIATSAAALISPQAAAQSVDSGDVIDTARPLVVDPQIFRDSGINRFSLAAAGSIELPRAVNLYLDAGGELELRSERVRIDGRIRSPQGSVNLISTASQQGNVELGSAADIDVSGLWVNDSRLLNPDGAPAADHSGGGNVTINSVDNLVLARGSRIDVSGGARLTLDGDLRAGNAGSITLASKPGATDRTRLVLDGDLIGYGMKQGGSLKLDANGFRLANVARLGTDADGNLVLPPNFFTRHGFTDFSFVARFGGFEVADGTRVLVRPLNTRLLADFAVQPTGEDLDLFSEAVLLPDYLRGSSSLTASVERTDTVADAEAVIQIGRGARIETEAGGAIVLRSDSDITVDGTLQAAGGSISLALGTPRSANDTGFRRDQAIRLGAASRLLAPGQVELEPNAANLRLGEVLDGGSVSLTADRGYVITAKGSIVDVSGAAQTLDVPTGSFGRTQPLKVVSNAGRINLTAAEGLLLAGSQVGRAGAANAEGGSLSVTLDSSKRDQGGGVANNPRLNQFLTSQPQVVVGGAVPAYVKAGTDIPDALNGLAFVDTTQVNNGGFSVLELKSGPVFAGTTAMNPGVIRFDGDVNLAVGRSLRLDAPVVASDGGGVTIAAPHVAIGSTDTRSRLPATAAEGAGAFTVNAQHIDLLGPVTLTGFRGESGGRAAVRFNSSGDIRAVGVRNISETSIYEPGSLTSPVSVAMRAAQVYPATLTDYTINVTGASGRIVIDGNGKAVPPLSAGGRLTLSANEIVQGGVLRAPFGEIRLNGAERVNLRAGSVTSTSGAGLVIPFGQTEFGEDWVFPLTGLKRLFEGVPAKNIALNSADVQLDEGSILDLRGGGDLTAYEFTPGPGGSKDLLGSLNDAGSFAIIPGYSNRYGVYDPLESPGSGIAPGQTIHLAGGAGLKAGEYVVLPARYALLPGAYLVTPTGIRDVSPNGIQTIADGKTPIVAGQLAYAGTPIRENRWSGYIVENGTQLRERVDYIESRASGFFGNDAGSRTADAGRLIIEADRSVALRGSLLSAAAKGGRGAQVDLVADDIAVVKAATGNTARVEFVQDELSALRAESLFLGGTRVKASDGAASLQVASSTVRVESGVSLSGTEVLLAARDEVTVAAGANVRAGGASIGRGASTLKVDGDGALARVSTGSQVSIERSNISGTTGRLAIESGAELSATGSITLDATSDLVSAGELFTNGGSLGLNASRISLGDVTGAVGGLVLSGPELARLQGGELLLTSRSTIDLYGGLAANFDLLRLDTAGLRGFDNRGETTSLGAQRIVLANGRTTASTDTATGTGTLVLSAQEVSLGGGDTTIDGFDSVRIIGTDRITGSGDAGLQVDGHLRLEAARLTGGKGAAVEFVANGDLVTARSGAAGAGASENVLGATMTLTGASVTHGTDIELHSGRAILRANVVGGDVILANDSSIDVSGVDRDYGDVRVSSPGGTVDLLAAAGGVTIHDLARIDVSGATAADAGELNILAGGEALVVESRAQLEGRAASKYRSGAIAMDVAALDRGFGALNAIMNAGGFNSSRSLTQQTGDIVLGASDIVRASAVTLVADGGAVDVAGMLNATAEKGGQVRLVGRDNVTLRPSARIDARATGKGYAGGDVELSTRQGTITIEATDVPGQFTIHVGGTDASGAPTATGEVHLRAPRVGVNGVAVGGLAGQITGTEAVEIEAFRVYENVTSLNPGTYSAIAADTAAYMANADVIKTTLGVGENALYRLIAGEELRSSGDMAISGRIEMQTRRYGGEAGVLTLRAAGDLSINASLSDGFASQSVGGQATREVVQTGPSWSYRLVGGAATGNADPLAVVEGAGGVTVAGNTYVRTGTGDIDIAAGGDVTLSAANSAIYTVGESRGHGAVDAVAAELLLRGDFVHRGGDVRVNALGDVNGVAEQVLPDWLPRFGGVLSGTTNPALRDVDFPAMWAIAAEKFRQGFGALGGGDVTIRAGGDTSGVSAVVATTGLPMAMDGSDLSVAGGGDLRVLADGSIQGGVFTVMKGEAELRAGDAVTSVATAATTTPVAPILQMGDTAFRVNARTGVDVETTFNPTVVLQDPRQGVTGRGLNAKPSYFFTYTDRSSVDLSAIAGDTVVAGRSANIETLAARDLGPINDALRVYPGTLRARSLEGAVIVDGDIRLFPLASGNLDLIADDDVTSNGSGSIFMSDGDVTVLPLTSNPAQLFDNAVLSTALLGHAPTPIHEGDDVPVRILSRSANVGPRGNGELNISVPKRALIYSGHDVSNLNLSVQHDDDADYSVVEAARDVIFPTLRNGLGNVDANGRRIDVSGPGSLHVLAGRDVDLGASDGIETRGNLNNAALPESGADINVMTGLAGDADLDGFFNRYVRDGQEYRDELSAFLRRFPQMPGADAPTRFKALDDAYQREFLLSVLFNEVREAGIAATGGDTSEFDRGFAAIKTLFPAGSYAGDLRSFLSKITTLDGGSINLAVPGGLVNAGVASSSALSKSADKLGVVIQRDGSLNAIVDGDFLVNQSRVFALDGGDIMIWSSKGDIDAGRGAKTALAIPPPVISFDAKGNVTVEFPPAISGSGIRAAVTTTGRAPGDVFLFAPSGVVNAGDAGIESAGNITVAAVQVLGADNINAGGVSVGVPTVSTGSLAAGLAGVGDVAAAATKSVTEGVASADAADAEQAAQEAVESMAAALSFISVEFLGYGEG